MIWPSFDGLVLAVHPTASGFGWVLFERPELPLDWGIAYAREGRHLRLVNRFERLLSKYEPSVLVLEQFCDCGADRADRIRKLCRAFERMASAHGMDTPLYSRAAVASCLDMPEGASRYEVAKAVASRLDVFSHKMPRKRALGDAEVARQSLFSAAAVAFAHFAAHGVPLPPVHPGAPE